MTLSTNLVVTLAVLVLNFCNSKVLKLDRRIVGGENANINDRLYLLSLLYRGDHIGGGCILNEITVLTAAHCVISFLKDPSDLSVRAGSNYTKSEGEVVNVAGIKLHPKFYSVTLDYDISILRLIAPLTIGVKINLPRKNQKVPVGGNAEVAGWGLTIQYGNVADHLQKVEVQRINQNTCYKSYNGEITSSMFCFCSKNKDACQGDSGSPLVYKNVVIGIVSWGIGCANPEYPGVYTRISHPLVYAFITNNQNEH